MATRNKTATFLKFREAVRRSQPLYVPDTIDSSNDLRPGKSKGGYVRLELTER